MNIINNIKLRFNQANIVEKTISINVAVFILLFILNTLGFLFQINGSIAEWFVLPATLESFIIKPWTIITYGFIHVDFIHILMNLISLYFIGNLFVQYFTPKQFISFYILGTLFGGIVFLLSYNLFPAFSNDVSNSILLGASAGVSAIFIGLATYIPKYQLKIPLIGFVKLWHLAAIWVALDVIQIPAGNAGGRLAHIGGALFGFFYVNQASNSEIAILSKIKNFFFSKNKPLKTVYKTNKSTKKQANTTYKQQKINVILDKISKSGYDTLSKEEKDFLFKQGK
ncbi:MAG: rhomboid family intramembrane serine protease [Polaribacter sp.]|nr:rhomboid family intramembrane serine protease [Polaribacter sp.]MDG1812224.1 rhomboid family intramembrane serine protease [Polaribacter sp.]MDG1993770.1 rhomboid family intramembrane serine protease [Polaribacter sp.]